MSKYDEEKHIDPPVRHGDSCHRDSHYHSLDTFCCIHCCRDGTSEAVSIKVHYRVFRYRRGHTSVTIVVWTRIKFASR